MERRSMGWAVKSVVLNRGGAFQGVFQRCMYNSFKLCEPTVPVDSEWLPPTHNTRMMTHPCISNDTEKIAWFCGHGSSDCSDVFVNV